MKRLRKVIGLCLLLAAVADAEQRVIVRDSGGQTLLTSTCLLLGCNVIRGLGDPAGQVFLVGVPDTTDLTTFLNSLLSATGVVDAEVDRLETVLQTNQPVPQALSDTSTVSYYGTSVRSGYVGQPAVQIVHLPDAQSTYGVAGTGIVAVIDTGVDPNHPVLAPVLVPGYDFTRDEQGTASEMADVTQSTAAVVDGVPPAAVSYYADAVIDQSTAAVVDTQQYAAFGHGTMVSGVIHLVAPRAMIMPLKAFGPNGSGYTSDILRAIYWAVRYNARVINMSFSMPQPSTELGRAVSYAVSSGLTCVAAVGNEGQSILVYPAAFSSVIGVASTTNSDVRSTFSNYGPVVFVAAPGEAIITTYPYSTYAAAWGTSFSTPFVAGTAALLLQVHGSLSPAGVAAAISHAQTLTPDLGYGRLDILQALQAAQ